MLEVDSKVYTESFDAENTADPQSFITNNSPIQPGESATGDIVFDVPPHIARDAVTQSRAGLFVGNFGDDLSQGIPGGIGFLLLHGA